jgi:hypothetical protein
MAKPLVFVYQNQPLPFEMTRVDRSKLYGFKETEVLDEQQQSCELATLASDGKTVVGRGGTGIAYMTPDGLWCERGTLTAINLEGQPIKPVPSSFDAAIPLERTVSVEQFLDYDVRAVYLLRGVDLPDDLRQQLQQGTIFQFSFSFRGGVEAEPAFLLMNNDEHLFMLIGKETSISFVGLQQTAEVMEEEEPEEVEGDPDDLDFSMI